MDHIHSLLADFAAEMLTIGALHNPDDPEQKLPADEIEALTEETAVQIRKAFTAEVIR